MSKKKNIIKNKINRNLLLTLFLIFMFFIGFYVLNNTLLNSTTNSIEVTKREIGYPDWKVTSFNSNKQIVENTKNGISFMIPTTYNFNNMVNPMEITPKNGELDEYNDSLKVVLFQQPLQVGEDLEKIYSEQGKNMAGKVLQKNKTNVGGFEAIRYSWDGSGQGESIIFIAHGQKYYMEKYPLNTSRQQEFEEILSSFTFK